MAQVLVPGAGVLSSAVPSIGVPNTYQRSESTLSRHQSRWAACSCSVLFGTAMVMQGRRQRRFNIQRAMMKAGAASDVVLKEKLDKMKATYELGNFEEKVDDMQVAWRRGNLPYKSARREAKAERKKNMCLRNKEFFESMEFLKPLALKYPEVGKHTQADWLKGNTIENYWEYKVDSQRYLDTERTAGFTYESFVDEFKTMTAESEESGKAAWKQPQVGDEVTGKFMHFTRSGAFIDIGAKKWAFVPINLISMFELGTSSDIHSIGDEVTGRVISTTSRSRFPTEEQTQMPVLSLIEAERRKAQEEVRALLDGKADEGQNLSQNVRVVAVRPAGVLVQMQNGLKGWVPEAEMGNQAVDSSLVGQNMEMELVKVRDEQGEVPLEFSYKRTQTKKLIGIIKQGQVVEGPVYRVRPQCVDVVVAGVVVEMSKKEVTNLPMNSFEMMEAFKVGEQIKCYVQAFGDDGILKLSTRIFEANEKGTMLSDREKCFKLAEKRAAMQLEADKQQADDIANRFSSTLQNVKDIGDMNLDDENGDDALSA